MSESSARLVVFVSADVGKCGESVRAELAKWSTRGKPKLDFTNKLNNVIS